LIDTIGIHRRRNRTMPISIGFQKIFQKKSYTYPVIFWIILFISVIIAVFFWSVSKHTYDNQVKELFESNVDENLDRMNGRIVQYENALRSGIAFFQASDSVSRQEWQYFVEMLQLHKHYPGLHGIGFAMMLHPDEVTPLEERMRSQEGYPSFTLKPEGEREQYSAVLYLEPMDERNVKAIGYDMFSEPMRRKAMIRARDTGLASASGRVVLAQETDLDAQTGFLLYFPLYKTKKEPDTIEARRNALLGFVYSPFQMKYLMSKLTPKYSLLDLEIYDDEWMLEDDLLYRSFEPSSYVSKHSTQRTLEVGGRIWHIRFLSTAEFDTMANNQYPWLLTLGRLLLYLFLVFIILQLVKNRQKLRVKTKELESNRAWLNNLLSSSVDGIHILDLDGQLIEYSPSFLKMLGYDNNEAQLLSVYDWDSNLSREKITEVIGSMSEVPITFETQYRRKDGMVFDVEITARKIELEGKRYIYASSRDITMRKQAGKELRKLSQVVEQSPHTVVITDLEGNIEYVNNSFTRMSGYTRAEAIGKNPRLLQSGKTISATYDAMWGQLTKGKPWAGEFVNRRKDGTEYTEALKVSPLFQTDGTIVNYMAIKEDISEKKRNQNRIHYLANFDVLTKLPNRVQLEEKTAYAINFAKRKNGKLALLFLDLDHFKNINDTLGHRIGDLLLMKLAKRFRAVLREEDVVSRFGGDEFIFMVPHTDIQGITHVVQKLLSTIAKPVIIEHNELTVTASIGIALYPADGKDYGTLTKNADIAMYRAKEDGRNNYCFFTEAMQERSTRNLQLTNALRHALEQKQLHVVYQPQISLHDGRIIGAEALLRWIHPELGNISPTKFIPLAEESGIILSIGEWVLRTAVKQAKSWIEHGLSPMIVAVNLSAVQFRHPRLAGLVADILGEIGLPPEYLEIELTEAVAMSDPKRAYAVMDKLHEQGVRMAIDDFGTGYSSLSYLKKFKVYKLKIDQSFIRNIHTDPEDKAIVAAIISMAHSLGLKTIAEGVETLEQLNFLREQGCDEIQGYYYSKPLTAEVFEIFAKSEIKS